MSLLVAGFDFHLGLAEQSQKAESLHTCLTDIHRAGQRITGIQKEGKIPHLLQKRVCIARRRQVGMGSLAITI